ncbi:Uncharacterized protein TCAP_04224 [Tolypocladium capitatum]|uniref:ATPase, vacuolar ER assembly factor, Vma12 n=1 Tax=Tolypocladium capitatum TaxID=45235 RepID=A0A2K3QE73_9HYPO|nr:Uncharacterized protein TCAP_04224 [Tolypocladium capitatum]
MTPSIVDGLDKLRGLRTTDEPPDACDDGEARTADDSEPSLAEPAVGKPISHGQVVDLWKRLRTPSQHPSHSLEKLLQGSQVYVPPPAPKAEQVGPSVVLDESTAITDMVALQSDEYKALMARLRREEAARAYERMVNPRPRIETFSDRFPTAAQSFAAVNRPTGAADLGDDDVTLGEVHRQVMLILNFLVSIIGVAATLWVSARWWSLPARLFLTMGGSIVVAIAEVGVYQGYVWRMGRSKSRQRAVKEVKQVVQTWVVGQDEGDRTVLLKSKEDDADGALRKRAVTATTTPET